MNRRDVLKLFGVTAATLAMPAMPGVEQEPIDVPHVIEYTPDPDARPINYMHPLTEGLIAAYFPVDSGPMYAWDRDLEGWEVRLLHQNPYTLFDPTINSKEEVIAAQEAEDGYNRWLRSRNL